MGKVWNLENFENTYTHGIITAVKIVNILITCPNPQVSLCPFLSPSLCTPQAFDLLSLIIEYFHFLELI